MLGAESLSPQWYRVPPGGQSTFTLSEEWTRSQRASAANTLIEDATVAVG